MPHVSATLEIRSVLPIRVSHYPNGNNTGSHKAGISHVSVECLQGEYMFFVALDALLVLAFYVLIWSWRCHCIIVLYGCRSLVAGTSTLRSGSVAWDSWNPALPHPQARAIAGNSNTSEFFVCTEKDPSQSPHGVYFPRAARAFPQHSHGRSIVRRTNTYDVANIKKIMLINAKSKRWNPENLCIICLLIGGVT